MDKHRLDFLLERLIHNTLTKEQLDELLGALDEEGVREHYEGYLKIYFDQVLEEQNKKNPAIEAAATEGDQRGVPLLEAADEESEKRGNYFFRMAASLLFLISFAALAWLLVTRYNPPDRLATAVGEEEPPAQVEQVSPRGTRPTFTLHDGSLAQMNAASRLSYPERFSAGTRQVQLEGQAYFDVERDEARPFLISAQGLTVEVLGTSFDVKAYAEDPQITVTVESGKVKVYHPEAPEQALVLTRNQKLVWDKATAAFSVAEVEAGGELAWRYGVLHFNQTPVGEVERLLERWYDVEVVIADSALYGRTLTGTHKNESLEAVLRSLSFALNTTYQVEGKTVRVSRNR